MTNQLNISTCEICLHPLDQITTAYRDKWKTVSLSPQVLPPFLGAERSVLQCDGLLWPGEYAQVSLKAALLFFLVLVQGINRKPAKLVKYNNYLDK